MSEERRVRIAELEAEVKKLKEQEEDDRRAMLTNRVETLFQGLHYADVAIIKELVEDQEHRLWALEGPDDE